MACTGAVALLGLAVTLDWAPLLRLDAAIAQPVHDAAVRSPWAVEASRFLETIGRFRVSFWVATAVVLVLLALRRWRLSLPAHRDDRVVRTTHAGPARPPVPDRASIAHLQVPVNAKLGSDVRVGKTRIPDRSDLTRGGMTGPRFESRLGDDRERRGSEADQEASEDAGHAAAPAELVRAVAVFEREGELLVADLHADVLPGAPVERGDDVP